MTYRILEKSPQSLIDQITYYWLKDRYNLEQNDTLDFWRADHTQDCIIPNSNHKLNEIVNQFLPINHSGIMYSRNLPKCGLSPVHIDSNINRGCAINIPLNVDLNWSFFFIGPENCTERPIVEGEQINSGSKRYEYEPEKYQYYNLKKPILLDTKKPHGFANFAETDRVILSISFSENYEYILDNLPKDWFV